MSEKLKNTISDLRENTPYFAIKIVAVAGLLLTFIQSHLAPVYEEGHGEYISSFTFWGLGELGGVIKTIYLALVVLSWILLVFAIKNLKNKKGFWAKIICAYFFRIIFSIFFYLIMWAGIKGSLSDLDPGAAEAAEELGIGMSKLCTIVLFLCIVSLIFTIVSAIIIKNKSKLPIKGDYYSGINIKKI